jgi:hypothetical protein
MKRAINIIGIVSAAIGILWILQGTDIIKSGVMAGHSQWAIAGIIAVLIGLALMVFASRRQKTTQITGGPKAS